MMQLSISVNFLQRLWHLAAQNGLLDETDIDLLEEAFTTAANKNAFINLIILPIIEFLILLSASISISLPLFTNFVQFALVSFNLIFFYLLALFFLPNAICYFWSEWVDRRFRRFTALLRHKELCLFSLQHFNQSKSQSPLPLLSIRKICLQQLRQFIQSFNQSSNQLAFTPDEKEKLFINFIGDEMRALAKLPLTYLKPNIEVNENNLHTTDLKSLWQFMFLIRSEFLRISILVLLQEIHNFRLLNFVRYFAIFSYTFFCTSSLMVYIDNWRERQIQNKTIKECDRGDTNIVGITPLTICKTKLEWALEKLMEFENSSTSIQWPPDAELKNELTSCLLGINTILNVNERNQIYACNEEIITRMALHSKCNNDVDLNCQAKEESPEDYQIFEFDLANNKIIEVQRNPQKISDLSTRCIDNSRSILFTPYGTHNAVISELKYALIERKENCLEREMQALARKRGLPIENMMREELDRAPFSLDKKAQLIMPEKPVLSQGHFGVGSLDTTDLNSILLQRKKLMENTKDCKNSSNDFFNEECFCDDDLEISENSYDTK